MMKDYSMRTISAVSADRVERIWATTQTGAISTGDLTINSRAITLPTTVLSSTCSPKRVSNTKMTKTFTYNVLKVNKKHPKAFSKNEKTKWSPAPTPTTTANSRTKTTRRLMTSSLSITQEDCHMLKDSRKRESLITAGRWSWAVAKAEEPVAS